MNENQEFKGIPQEQKESTIKLKFVSLFSSLVKRYGRDFIMKYIEDNTVGGTAPIVVERWLNGEHIPSPIICKGIISALENFSPDSLPIAPLAVKDTSSLISKSEINKTPVSKKPKLQEVKNNLENKKKKRDEKLKKITEDNDEKLKVLMEKLRQEGSIL